MVETSNFERGARTANDYITRLKSLSDRYIIDSSITMEKIDDILESVKKEQEGRAKYAYKSVIGDLRTGLKKFLAFVQDYEKQIDEEVDKIEKSTELPFTEKEAIIQARVGQGLFRHNLIEYWKGCSITRCDVKDFLIASHIKPWKDSNNKERIDVFNGLLLLPNYDKLFELGYITVNLNGEIVFSDYLLENKNNEQLLLHSNITSMTINIDNRHKPYLEYHNHHRFMK
jgi:predicted restriction endonuclease